MPQIEFVDTVADARERALDAFRTNTTRTIEGAGVIPERFLVAWLRRVKAQAKRPDLVGAAARGVLEVVHGPAGGAASFFTTIEKESSPPRRSPRRQAASSRPRGGAATKRTRAARSATDRTAGGRAGTDRRGAKRPGVKRSATRPAAIQQTAPQTDALQHTAPEEILPIVVG